MNDRTLSVKELCERYGVNEHTVLGWIRSGELRAINVGRRQGTKKPRWRITPEALVAFELLRTPTPPIPRTRRRKQAGEVIDFH
jgi:excisionase family DNA binding protein